MKPESLRPESLKPVNSPHSERPVLCLRALFIRFLIWYFIFLIKLNFVIFCLKLKGKRKFRLLEKSAVVLLK